MEIDDKSRINFLQTAFLGEFGMHQKILDDTGIKEKAAEIKHQFGELNAQRMKEAFQFTKVEEPFLFSAAMFECADWEVSKKESTTTIESKTCKFVGICRSMGTSDPCNMYCLEPMYQMAHAIDPTARITTKKTLWKGDNCCSVEIVQEVKP
ncbi:L-2-amino-thiazoline-4-carboxylic acid hydrolase [Sediminispirochaeta bajacaliforniensis]|uniref:L-2-amino-thiazoline-4-carboxylic acid hydrolase n=1 Tax=Sediminispirochaeta bajacaliforniensis TaxID=148 RepID=UPI00037988EC|nr:L-2-amino-thiazoline-4-carboxylic acid hydrolase [Sediminispirochaeta bajacaliforniensis]